MAEVTISTKVEAPDISSLQNLTKELKAAKAAALNGDGQAAKRVAELKDKIDDLKDATQTFQGSGVEKLKNSFGLLTDGFKNFDSDKVKIAFKGIGQAMSAIPVLLIVTGIMKLIENFDNLKNSSGLLGTAFKAIGTIIDTLTGAIADFTDWIGLTNIESEKLAETQINNAKKIQDAVTERYDAEIRLAKAAGKNTEDLEKQKIMAVRQSLLEQIKLKAQAAVLNGELNEEELKNLDELRKALTESYIQEKEIDLKAKKEQSERDKKTYEERKKTYEERKKTKEKELDDSQKLADELFAELSKNQDNIDKQNAEARKREKEAKEAAAKAEVERLKQIEDNNIKVQEDAVNELKNVLALRVQVAEAGSQDQLNALLNQLETEKQLTLAKYDEGTEERLLLEQKFQSQKDQLITDYRNKQFKEDLQVATDGFTALQGLSDTYFTLKQAQEQEGTEEYERNAKKQFEINKALQLGTAVITGIQSILAITSVPDFTLGVATAIRIAAQVALNVASIAKIATTKYKSTSSAGGGVPKLSTGGGGGGNVNPSQPNIPAPKPQDSTQFDEQGNRINSQPIIVKVSEINDTQSRVARVKEQSVF